MKEDKVHLINRLSQNETIRTAWYKEDKKYNISVMELVEVLSGSNNLKIYWRVMKNHLRINHKD